MLQHLPWFLPIVGYGTQQSVLQRFHPIKLDVAGSIPVSRSFSQQVRVNSFLPIPFGIRITQPKGFLRVPTHFLLNVRCSFTFSTNLISRSLGTLIVFLEIDAD